MNSAVAPCLNIPIWKSVANFPRVKAVIKGLLWLTELQTPPAGVSLECQKTS